MSLAHTHLLSDRVKGGCRLVKDEDGSVLEDGPCYGHSLLLAPGQLEAALPNLKMLCRVIYML